MKPKTIFIGILISAVCSALSLHAQPAFEGPPPSREVLQSADQRNAAYAARINEVLDWRIGLAKPETLDMATIAMLLVRNQDIELCNQRVIEMMKEPGTVACSSPSTRRWPARLRPLPRLPSGPPARRRAASTPRCSRPDPLPGLCDTT